MNTSNLPACLSLKRQHGSWEDAPGPWVSTFAQAPTEPCPSAGGTLPLDWTILEGVSDQAAVLVQLLRCAFKSPELCNFPFSHLDLKILAVYSDFRFDLSPSAQTGLLDLDTELSSFGFTHYLWLGQ